MAILTKCPKCEECLIDPLSGRCLGCGATTNTSINNFGRETKEIKLTPSQAVFAEHIMAIIRKDPFLIEFSGGRATGKTFFFNWLENKLKNEFGPRVDQLWKEKPPITNPYLTDSYKRMLLGSWVPKGDIYTPETHPERFSL